MPFSFRRRENALAIRSRRSAVVGLQYESPTGHDRQKIASSLKLGTLIELKREPDNHVDEQAVACWYEQCHLGYIPERSHWIAASLDEGDTLRATVIEHQYDEDGEIYALSLRVDVIEDGNRIGRVLINPIRLYALLSVATIVALILAATFIKDPGPSKIYDPSALSRK